MLTMKTLHKIIYSDAREMEGVKSESVDLMITSPPISYDKDVG